MLEELRLWVHSVLQQRQVVLCVLSDKMLFGRQQARRSMRRQKKTSAFYPFQLLKMSASIADVNRSYCRYCKEKRLAKTCQQINTLSWPEVVLTYWRIRHDNHDVCVGGERVNERSEGRVSYLHLLEGRRYFGTTQLELFNDVTDLLTAMDVALILALTLRYNL